MIIDIPTSDEFHQQGLDLFNLAWNAITLLLDEHVSIQSISDWNSKEAEKLYWSSSQRSLATSISLIQQGVEFFLKSKIVQISPYLLITGAPQDWPRGAHKADTPFSDFKTIDAQDLIYVHNTVASSRLPDEFNSWFNDMRRLRNKVIHTVDKNLLLSASDVLTALLQGHEYLVGSQKWIRDRITYLQTSPTYIIDRLDSEFIPLSEGYQRGQLSREVFHTIDLLQPSLVKKFFDFNKKQRRYICPHCIKLMLRQDFFEINWEESNQPHFSAQLRPNEPTSTTIYCILCDRSYSVLRKQCEEEDCLGNVIDVQSGYCLTCYFPIP